MTTPTQPLESDAELLARIADRLKLCEFQALPFTEDELEAIARYQRDTLGLPDSIDSPSAEGHHEFAREFGNTAAIAMVRADFAALSLWWDRITQLREDLPRDCYGDRSRATVNYLGYEVMAWNGARNELQAAALAWTLGVAEAGCRSYSDPLDCDGFRYVDGMFWIPA